MSTLIITRGLPGSGKTTFALKWTSEAPRRVRVNRDDTRYSLYDAYSGLTWEGEGRVTKVQQAIATSYLAEGFDVIIDDTNLNAKTVKGWQKVARDNNAEFRNIDFPMEPSTCKEMVSRRVHDGGRAVPDEVIDKMNSRYLRSGKFPAIADLEPQRPLTDVYVPDPALPTAYLVDVDGTLTTGPHDRSPYDWDKVSQDKVNEPVARLIRALPRNTFVIVVSGRDGSCRKATYRWLVNNEIWFDHLLMREAGDNRKDAVVKAEIFDRDIRNRYNVLGVFDDRDQCVALWRSLGLTCFQVAPGAF
jgi:predicted kinase